MAFALSTSSFAPRTVAPQSTRPRVRVAIPRRFSQLVRAEQTPVDQAEQAVKEVEQTVSQATTSAADNVEKAAYTPVQPTKAPSFGDAMAFSGPAPEVINGRLAMLAFVAAAGAELATGAPIAAQLKDAPILIGLTFFLFSAASLIPILRGAKLDKSVGPFNPRAEILNGRVAMLGFAALLVSEWANGGAFF
ncbi:Carotene biosynthesis-related protein CBR, chloroplastic at C-terminar half [Coccomyxa sp. Obi]|nr:Carotene biosynthesis-related protein CBR, chloroplastic at C-terminar half [Coccomyxa sp. Obi]